MRLPWGAALTISQFQRVKWQATVFAFLRGESVRAEVASILGGCRYAGEAHPSFIRMDNEVLADSNCSCSGSIRFVFPFRYGSSGTFLA